MSPTRFVHLFNQFDGVMTQLRFVQDRTKMQKNLYDFSVATRKNSFGGKVVRTRQKSRQPWLKLAWKKLLTSDTRPNQNWSLLWSLSLKLCISFKKGPTDRKFETICNLLKTQKPPFLISNHSIRSTEQLPLFREEVNNRLLIPVSGQFSKGFAK